MLQQDLTVQRLANKYNVAGYKASGVFMRKEKINGFDCFYRYVEKDKSFPTVVFLNGIMSPKGSWLQQVALLEKKNYNYLLFEYRGQWNSEVTPEKHYSMALHAEDLKQLLDKEGITRVHMVGTSYGGFVAIKFAVTYSDIVDSIQIYTSAAVVDERSRKVLEEWRDKALSKQAEVLYNSMVQVIFSESYIKNNEADLNQRVELLKNICNDPFFEGQAKLNETGLNDLTGNGLLDELSQIRCPVLVIAASEDKLYPPECSEIIAENIPNSQYLIVPDCGHALLVEKPEVVNIIMIGFLESLL